MSVSIREARASDAAEMARLQAASLAAEASRCYSDEQLAHLVPREPDADAIPEAEFEREGRYPVVAERDGEVVGWGTVHLDEGVLAATFVAPAATDSGVGRAVVEALAAAAREAGLDSLTVHAALNAVGFYERLGFERRREVDVGGPDGPAVPGVEMRRDL